MPINDLDEKLKKHNYRLTNQRETILEVMQANRGKHLSAEDVLREARSKNPVIGIATVYRTLDILANMEVLAKSMFGDKFRYELCDHDRHQHHHIVCLACGSISEVQEDLLNPLETHLEGLGYEIIDHELKFYAYCPDCSRKKK